MTNTNGYVERSIVRVLATANSDSKDNLSEHSYSTTTASIDEVLEHVSNFSDALPRSQAAAIRRAFRELEDKGLIERAGKKERRQYWQLTEGGIAEAETLRDEYQKRLSDLNKRYGGKWLRSN